MPMKLAKIFRKRRTGKKESCDEAKTTTSKLLKRLGTRLTTKDSMDSVYTQDEGSSNHMDASHSVYEVIELNNTSTSFLEQFETIKPSRKSRSLVLQNFVEKSTRQDTHALRDLLANEKIAWKRVQLKDNAPTSCRRWTYKKDNILHHTNDLCKARGIALVFEASMGVIVEEMPSFETVFDVLDQVDKDNDITQLTLKGKLNDREVEQLLQAVTSLISKEDRIWDKVSLQISFGGSDPFQWQQWRQTIEKYAFLFSQMEVQYGFPIEVARQ